MKQSICTKVGANGETVTISVNTEESHQSTLSGTHTHNFLTFFFILNCTFSFIEIKTMIYVEKKCHLDSGWIVFLSNFTASEEFP